MVTDSPTDLDGLSARAPGDATALLVTCDEQLLDDVLRLAAAAGLGLDVAHDLPTALRAWSAASVVLVGADLAPRLADRRLPRRDQVYLVGRAPLVDGLFRAALSLGARHVVELPAAETWLVELLTDLADGDQRRGVTVGVVGGSGGVGATTFAAALALVGATHAPAVLMDLDPWGPGADRVVGFDDLPGVRWDALLESAGRLSARALREAVPHQHGLGVLTWAGTTGRRLEAVVLDDVLSAARRGHELVVLDLPRHVHDVGEQALAHCDHVVLVSGLQVPAVASTSKVAHRLRTCAGGLHLLTRSCRGAGLDADQVAEMLGLPLLARVADQRRLAEDIDLALGPVRSARGPLARAARAAYARLAAGGGQAAA